MTSGGLLVQIDGAPPEIRALEHPALVNYGHFTAMQVRGGATRGLDKHLARLRSAHLELFGSRLDLDRTREFMRLAAQGRPDSYLRITAYENPPGEARVMTVTRPPIEPGSAPVSLLPVNYSRPLAHVKHVGSFAQIFYGEHAQRQGYGDALLVGPDGGISETTTANIGFVKGAEIVWPGSPALRGITWQILDERLAQHGLTSRTAVLTLADAQQFEGAFLANSIGIVPVGRIGEHLYSGATPHLNSIIDTYAQAPQTVI